MRHLLRRLGAQPQRDVGWLHRLPYHTHQVPDGNKIAFDSFKLSSNGFLPNSGEIYVSAADGSGPTNLTNYSGSDDGHPDWSPK